MKIAIVHDELMRRGGAEQVVKCFHRAFPEAPIYTSAYQPELTYPEFKSCDIRTSWLQKIVRNEKQLKMLFFPFGLWAMQQLEVLDYDVVLISSTYSGKYVKVSPQTIVINYCHNPFRLAWYPESYQQYLKAKGIKKKALDMLINYLKKVDWKAAQRTNYFLTNASEVRERIKEKYQPKEDIQILQPPVNSNLFHLKEEIGDYYLVVARLEYYKRVDLVVEAFNDLGLPLVIVGKGSMEKELKKMAKAHIQFKSGISHEALADLYAGCKAFIFPQHEDYGITPLEAIASGRPVIAYGKGGVLDTMRPYRDDAKKATALFFEKQEATDLKAAIQTFEQLQFDPAFIRAHALNFNEEAFVEKVQTFVRKVISNPIDHA